MNKLKQLMLKRKEVYHNMLRKMEVEHVGYVEYTDTNKALDYYRRLYYIEQWLRIIDREEIRKVQDDKA